MRGSGIGGDAVRRPLLVVCFVAVGARLASGCDWPQFGYGPRTPCRARFVDRAHRRSWRTRATLARRHDDGPVRTVEAVAGGVAYAAETRARRSASTASPPSTRREPRTAAGRRRRANRSGPLRSPPAATPRRPGRVAGTAVTTVGGLQAFDATGTTGCSGVPKVCQPLWRGPPLLGLDTPPTVASGARLLRVPHLQELPFTAGLAVRPLRSARVRRQPRDLRAPLWTGRVRHALLVGGPTLGGGRSGVPRVGLLPLHVRRRRDHRLQREPSGLRTPLRAAIDGGAQPGPRAVVANGTVFVGSAGLAQVVGFDAAGDPRCGGTPKTCLPIWIAKKADAAVPTVANGKVYLSGTAGALSVFDADRAVRMHRRRPAEVHAALDLRPTRARATRAAATAPRRPR